MRYFFFISIQLLFIPLVFSTTLTEKQKLELSKNYTPVIAPKNDGYSWYRILGILGKVGTKDNGQWFVDKNNLEINFHYGFIPSVAPRVAEYAISVANPKVIEQIANSDKTGINRRFLNRSVVIGYHTTYHNDDFLTNRRLDSISILKGFNRWPKQTPKEILTSYKPFLNHVVEDKLFKSKSERVGRLIGVSRHHVDTVWGDSSYNVCLLYISELGLNSSVSTDSQGNSYELTRGDVQPVVGLDEKLCAWSEFAMNYNVATVVEYREYSDSSDLLPYLPDAHVALKVSVLDGDINKLTYEE